MSLLLGVLALWLNLSTAAASTEKHLLQSIEIAGIALNTPPESIDEILQARGFSSANRSLYTQQQPMPNGRSALYRIEIEDTAAFRQIYYSRSLGGGRLKSPSARDATVPAEEMDMVRQLYHAVCSHVTEALQTERACQPLTPIHVGFGQGRFIELGEGFSALLDATDASTTISIKQTK